MIKWTLPIACAFALSACGAFGTQEPMTTGGYQQPQPELPETTGTAGLQQVDPASGAGVPERVSPEGIPMDAAEDPRLGQE